MVKTAFRATYGEVTFFLIFDFFRKMSKSVILGIFGHFDFLDFWEKVDF
jgi:hypothetical protein